MILTNEIIEAGRSRNGGWGSVQCKLFKVKMNKSGWKNKIIGKDFPQEIIDSFLALKDAHLLIDVEFNGRCRVCRKHYRLMHRWNADKVLGRIITDEPILKDHECKGKSKRQLGKETVNTNLDPQEEFFYMTSGI